MANIKTNAMRILDDKNIKYNVLTYNTNDGKVDGISVSKKINKNPKFVYKTLVTQGNSKEIYVFVVPVEKELNLKKSAKVVKEKNISMIAVKDIKKITGYIRGGCSPIGMKKDYKTFIDKSASKIEKIIISAGKIGVQIEIEPKELESLINARFADIT